MIEKFEPEFWKKVVHGLDKIISAGLTQRLLPDE